MSEDLTVGVTHVGAQFGETLEIEDNALHEFPSVSNKLYE